MYSGKWARLVAFQIGVGTVALTRTVSFNNVIDPLMVVIWVGKMVVFSIDIGDVEVLVVASVTATVLVVATVVTFTPTDSLVSFAGDIPILTTAPITTEVVSNTNIRMRLAGIVVCSCGFQNLLQIDAKCWEIFANYHEFDGYFTRRDGRQLIPESNWEISKQMFELMSGRNWYSHLSMPE